MQPADLQPQPHETLVEFSQRFRESLSDYPFEAIFMWHGDETSPLFTLQWQLGEVELDGELLEAEQDEAPEGWFLWELEAAGQRLGRVAFRGRSPHDCEGLEAMLRTFSKSLGRLLQPVLEEPDSLPELLDQVDEETLQPEAPIEELHWTQHNIYRPSKIPRSVTSRVLVDWL